jgi:nucleotide-binding universal stress UspA family protein
MTPIPRSKEKAEPSLLTEAGIPHPCIDLQPILVATDFSDVSARAVDYACELARRLAAELIVVHADITLAALSGTRIAARRRPTVEMTLSRLVRRLRRRGISVRGELLAGDAATQILDMAAKVHAGMIVMGTHGRSGLSKLVMGSVAQQVVRDSPYPVLTVRSSDSSKKR